MEQNTIKNRKVFHIIYNMFNIKITIMFMSICIASFISGLISHGETTMKLFCTYPNSFSKPLTYVRLFTHSFGHGDLQHIVINMLFFYLLGTQIEKKYGWLKYLIIITISSISIGLINNLFFNETILGASGIVSTFVIIYAIDSYCEHKLPPINLFFVIFYFIIEFYYSIFRPQDNIAHFAHVFGAIIGGIAAIYFNRKIIFHKK